MIYVKTYTNPGQPGQADHRQGWPLVTAGVLSLRFGPNDGLGQTPRPSHSAGWNLRWGRGSAGGRPQDLSSQPTGGHTWLSPAAAAGHPTALHPLGHFGRGSERPHRRYNGFCGHWAALHPELSPHCTSYAAAPPTELPPGLVVKRVTHGGPSHSHFQAAWKLTRVTH